MNAATKPPIVRTCPLSRIPNSHKRWKSVHSTIISILITTNTNRTLSSRPSSATRKTFRKSLAIRWFQFLTPDFYYKVKFCELITLSNNLKMLQKDTTCHFLQAIFSVRGKRTLCQSMSQGRSSLPVEYGSFGRGATRARSKWLQNENYWIKERLICESCFIYSFI